MTLFKYTNIKNNYYFQVEGGRIDHAHHDTIAHRALDELVAMDNAIEEALKMTNEKVGEGGVWCGQRCEAIIQVQAARAE